MKKPLLVLLLACVALTLAACMGLSGPSQVPPKIASMPDWSPTGALIAYVCAEDGPYIDSWDPALVEYKEEAYEICVMVKDGKHRLRLIHNETLDWYPVWSPDGQHIAFIGSDGLYTIKPDGTNLHRLVESRWIQATQASWSPDGKRLAFSECAPDRFAQVMTVDSDGNNLLPLAIENERSNEYPIWSPNGKQLAYRSSVDKCSGTYVFSDGYRIGVYDVLQGSSMEVVTQDFKWIHGLSWLTNRDLTFSAQGRVPNSDATQFDLYVIDLATRQITKPVDQVKYGRTYAWSSDRAFIAYDAAERVYVTPSSNFQPDQVWRVAGQTSQVSWSPDKQFLLVSVSELVTYTLNAQYTGTIWLISRDGKTATRLTEIR